MEQRRKIAMAMIYPFMQSLRESAFPAPGHTVNIKSFIPDRGTEVRTSDETTIFLNLEGCLNGSSVWRGSPYIFKIIPLFIIRLRLGLEGLHIVHATLLLLTSLSEQWLTTILVIVRYDLQIQCREGQQLLHFPLISTVFAAVESTEKKKKKWC